MAISKWNPFGSGSEEDVPSRRERFGDPLREMQNEMNRLFEHFFNRSAMQRSGMMSPGRTMTPGQKMKRSFNPRIDVSEDDETLNITAELPGLDKDDIELEANENGVTLKGEKSFEEEREDEGFYRSERSYGYFQRTIPFPTEVDTTKAKATFQDGILDVRFPKTGKSSGKQLEIE